MISTLTELNTFAQKREKHARWLARPSERLHKKPLQKQDTLKLFDPGSRWVTTIHRCVTTKRLNPSPHRKKDNSATQKTGAWAHNLLAITQDRNEK